MTTPAEIGERIRQKREALGMKQNQLAEKAGILAPTLSRIERGTNGRDTTFPTLENLQAIATALGCSCADLLGETKARKKAAAHG